MNAATHGLCDLNRGGGTLLEQLLEIALLKGAVALGKRVARYRIVVGEQLFGLVLVDTGVKAVDLRYRIEELGLRVSGVGFEFDHGGGGVLEPRHRADALARMYHVLTDLKHSSSIF